MFGGFNPYKRLTRRKHKKGEGKYVIKNKSTKSRKSKKSRKSRKSKKSTKKNHKRSKK
tara:strand:- start:338 stop:511 length:174 start_codon:yes stop_codon:yes gene_type:complete